MTTVNVLAIVGFASVLGMCSLTRADAPPLVHINAITPGISDGFGESVAIGEEFLVVGAPFDDDVASNGGSITVFWPDADGFPSTSIVESPMSLSADANFGLIVAASGNSIAVAAPAQDDGFGSPLGAVYVYTVSSVSISLQSVIQPSALSVSDLFASDIDLEGDTLLVGAPGANGGEGAVWMFTRTTGDWSSGTMYMSVHGDEGDGFGWSVAIDQQDETRWLVGAPYDSDLAMNSGRVYLFEDLGMGPAVSDEFDQSTVGTATNQLGHELDLYGDHLAVGEPLSTLIHVIGWDGSSSSWGLVESLSAPVSHASSIFGEAFALNGELLVAGDRLANTNGALSGTGYLFRLVDDSDWNPLAELVDDLGDTAYGLGHSVALEGSVLIMGSPGAQADTTILAGTVLGWAVDSNPGCISDVNMDGVVDAEDVAELILEWGICTDPTGCATDTNDDSVTGVLDLLDLLDMWGDCI